VAPQEMDFAQIYDCFAGQLLLQSKLPDSANRVKLDRSLKTAVSK
jgi:hypothetical protein